MQVIKASHLTLTEPPVLTLKYTESLVKMAKESSYKLPSNLTRKQRREWAKITSQKVL